MLRGSWLLTNKLVRRSGVRRKLIRRYGRMSRRLDTDSNEYRKEVLFRLGEGSNCHKESIFLEQFTWNDFNFSLIF